MVLASCSAFAKPGCRVQACSPAVVRALQHAQAQLRIFPAIGHVIGFYLRFQTLSVSDHCLDFDRCEFVGGGNTHINFLTIPIDQSIPHSCESEIEIGRLKFILFFLFYSSPFFHFFPLNISLHAWPTPNIRSESLPLLGDLLKIEQN